MGSVKAASPPPTALSAPDRNAALRGPVMLLALLAAASLLLCELHSVELGVALLAVCVGILYWLAYVVYPPTPPVTRAD